MSLSTIWKNQEVIKDISLEIQPGKTLGIWAQGWQKYLVQLIPRFHEPAAEILYNGHPLKDYSLKSLKSISLVQQDTFLFTSSVSNNVLYGDPWAAKPDVVSAAGGTS